MTKQHGSSRRTLIAGAVVIACAVVAGDVRLWQLFTNEHDDAIGRIGSERRLIEDAARAVLLDEIERRLSTALSHLSRIEADELADDEGLVYFDSNNQVLPRTFDALPIATTPSGERVTAANDAALYVDIDHDVPQRWRDGDEGGELYALMEDVRHAHGADDETFAKAVRAYLEKRAHSRIAGSFDAVFTLFVVDALLDRKNADPALVEDLLTRGRDVGGQHIDSIPGEMIRSRKWLTRDDAEFLRRKVVERFVRAGLDHGDFDRAWTSIETGPHIHLPRVVDERPVLLPGFLYARPNENAGSVEGLRLDETIAHDVVEADLRKRHLLLDGESIALAAAPVDDASLVRATLDAPRLVDAARAADRSLALKRVLLAVTSTFAAAAIGAAFLEVARRRRYDALRASFVAAVSHELRTPLASMRLLVESLLVGASDAKSVERLERLGRDVDGLDFLVENILSFSRFERGKLTPKKERAWLSEIALDAVEKCRHEAHATLITCDVVDDTALDVDPELVGLVVANLVRNAWQHNPKRARQGASVRVFLERDARHAIVRVVDDGNGVADLDRDRIFAEFERGSRPASRGTGLGLALCRQIARAHGGDVVLASTSPTGSTFTLTLPAHADSR